MKKISTRWLSLLVLAFAGFTVQAQSISVGDEATLIAAINTLNSAGVSGSGATITFTANIALTAALPAIGSATLNGSTNSGAPYLIDGAGFTLTANYAGTRTGSLTTGVNDAVLLINGTDYVTVQTLTFAEQVGNTTTATQIENAIGIYNRNAVTPFDGVQFLTVTGCTFNMNKVVANGSNASIYSTNYIHTGTASLAWAAFATLPGDMHREFTINNNIFNGSYNHVYYYNGSTTNGRNVSMTGNTMNNYGGGSLTAYGAYAIRLDGFTFNNNITTCNATQSSTNYALFASTNCGGAQVANGNTVTLRNAVTTSASNGIYFTSIGVSTSMENNTLQFGSFSALTTGAINGLYASNGGGVANQSILIRNNTITGQTLPGNNPGTTSSALNCFTAIVSNTLVGASAVIDQNTFTNNTRSGGGTVTVCNLGNGYTGTASNNNINGFTWVNNSVSNSSTFAGASAPGSNPINIFTNNTISNINISGTSTAIAGTLRGISSFLVSTAVVTITGNTITNLTYGTGVTTGTIIGINSQTHLTSTIANNVISGLSASQPTGIVTGINTSSDVTCNIYNNCISDLTTPNSTNNLGIFGINIVSGTTINATHNLIYLGSAAPLTSTGANFGATGVQQNATTALNLKNNIINIKGSAIGTGTFACVRRSVVGTANTKPANFNASSNIYNVTSGPWNFIYVEGTVNTTLKNGYAVSGLTADVVNNITNDPSFNTGCGLYKLLMLDAGTFSEDNLTANGTCFSPTGANFAEAAATTITTPAITLDLAGAPRSGTPDMGALEFAGTATDATAPLITFTNIPNTICTSDPNLNVTITDLSSINITAGTLPRIWFKKSTETNAYNGNTSADNGWKYAEALNTTSPFQFSIPLGLLNSAPVGADVIEYFVTAQDLAPSPNVAVNIASFPAGFCPLTVALDPAAYPVTGALKTFTILATPVTVTSVSSQSILCLSGTTVLSLTGDPSTGAYYQWNESSTGAPGSFTAIAGANSSTYTTGTFSTPTYFNCEISCEDLVSNGGTSVLFSSNVFVDVSNPAILTTTPATRCGIGSLTLSATSSAGTSINWYAAATGGSPIISPSFNIPVTGFNNDIVANGVGTNSTLGVTQSFGCDGAGYNFMDNTYKYTAANALPTCFMPTNRLIPSLLTSGLTYELQDYGTDVTLNNNALSIVNTSTAYTSPLPSTGTLTLSTPASYSTLKVLYETVVNIAPLTVDATVTFTDATTESFPANTCVNWFTATLPAYSGMGRATPTGAIQCGATPNMFELNLPLSVPNQAKQVASVTFSIPTVLTTGAFPYSVNYFHALALGGQVVTAPGALVTPTISATTTYYVSASTPGPNATGGRMNTLTAGGALSGVPRGVIFTANAAGTLNEIGFLSTGLATNVTVQLYNAGGTAAIGSPVVISIPANAGTASVPLLMSSPVSISIPSAGTYRIFATTISTASSLYYEFTAVTGYPYNIGSDYSITSSATALTGVPSLTTYYYFYKLGFTSTCSSTPRTPVDATITAPDALTITGAGTRECNDAVVALSVSSVLPTSYDSYIWSPVTNLYTDPAGTIAYTGTSETNLYFRSNVAGTTTHTIVANNSISLCVNQASFSNTVMPATVTVTGNNDLCISGARTLSLTPTTGISATNVQWNMNGSAISGANSLTYTTSTLTVTTAYSADIIDDNSNTCFTTASANVLVNNPIITGTTPGSRCGTGTVNLSATATGVNGAPNYNWYANAVGGAPLYTGPLNTFTTPIINATTDFYLSAAEGGGGGTNVGKVSLTPGQSFNTGTAAYLRFTALSNFTLNTVKIYPYSTVDNTPGTMTISIANSAGVVQQSTVVNVTGYSVANATPQVVTVNFPITPGVDQRILFTAFTGVTGAMRDLNTAVPAPVFPYEVPGVVSITNSSIAGYYYYFFDWNISNGCESARQAVTATVNPSPAITAASTSLSTCIGNTINLSVTSPNDPDYTYTWTSVPAGFTATGAGPHAVVVNSTSTVYNVSALDNTAGPFATCGAISSVTVTAVANPLTLVSSATPATICEGASAQLLATATIPAVGYTMNASCTTPFIDINATGTSVGTLGDDTEHNFSFPSFSFNGVPYTTARVGTNGVIVFGATTGDISLTNATLPSTANTAGNAFLAPYWDDLDIALLGTIKTEQVGNIFVVQFTNIDHNNFATGGITFQVQMNLTTGVISYVYPDVVFGSATYDLGLTATVGLQMSSTSAIQYSFNTASLANAQSICFTPSSGIPTVTYDWTANPTYLSATNIGNPMANAALATQTYSVTVTDVNGCTRSSSTTLTVNPAPTIGVSTTTPALCTGGSTNAVIDATGTSTSYGWMPGSLTGASVSVLPISTTTYTVTGTGANGCTASATQTIDVNPCNTNLGLNLWLEGYFDGTSAMLEVMTNQNYTVTPVAVGDVDDITVELREFDISTSTYTVIPNGSAVARLHTDGTAQASFPAAITGSYYVVINHRNHIQTWSTDPVAIVAAGPNDYNFTNLVTKAFGSNMVLLANGQYGFFVGDINQDEYVDGIDFPFLDADTDLNLSGVYVATDLNGDGFVDSFDFPLFDTNSSNNVQSAHP